MGRIVVLGGGESGYGSAILARVKGFDVFLSDAGTIGARYREALDAWAIPYEEGRHTESLILNADEVVKSPGIPEKAPIVRMLRERGVPIISEIEFAGRYTRARTICITGSNGKTTTTTLAYEILRDAGFAVELGGNIGRSFAYMVATLEDGQGRLKAASLAREAAGQAVSGRQTEGFHPVAAPRGGGRGSQSDPADDASPQSGSASGDSTAVSEPPDWYVLELSSFQLDGMYGFRADAAVLLNITPDHLDSYDYDMQRYVESKFRIIRNQRPDDTFIFCADDPVIAAELARRELPMELLPFSARREERPGATLRNGVITAQVGERYFSIDMAEMRIQGVHNAYDAMAAVLAAMAAGVPEESVRGTLRRFGGVEHRMEPAGELDGASYINDSKATNVDAVWYALESMTRPVVWIAGGTDKGNDYTPLLDFARTKVKTLVCMGADNTKLKNTFLGVVSQVVCTASLDEAMAAAHTAASPGDVVLLSPACASFDLFKNYEDRGRRFKQWVADRMKE